MPKEVYKGILTSNLRARPYAVFTEDKKTIDILGEEIPEEWLGKKVKYIKKTELDDRKVEMVHIVKLYE